MTDPDQWLRQVSDARNDFFKEPPDIFRAFEYSKKYTAAYEALIRSKVLGASNAIFGTPVPQGVAVFSFGAPSRNEMLGGSDADIAVYRAGNSEKELSLRERLVQSLERFKFTKVDTPVWGTLADIRRYMTTSVTEANQVIEAQYICGDAALHEQVEQLRASLYDREVIARNLIFQFFYFAQYFRKKTAPDHLNLKYCHGGLRDLLFPAWYAQLRKGIETDLQTTAVERGLQVLREDNLLPPDAITDILKAASATTFVRDEILTITPGDVDGKLSLQKAGELCGRAPHLFRHPQDILKVVEEARPKVTAAKTKVWEGLCKYFRATKSEKWNDYFRKVLLGEIAYEQYSELEQDEILNTVRIWKLEASRAEQSRAFLERVSQSDSWTVLASLLSSPYVAGKIIDEVIRRRGLTPGYEYFLEIAARNPNLSQETLEFIVQDETTEPRFKKPAFARAKALKRW